MDRLSRSRWAEGHFDPAHLESGLHFWIAVIPRAIPDYHGEFVVNKTAGEERLTARSLHDEPIFLLSKGKEYMMDFRYLSCLAALPLVVVLCACETSTPAGAGNRGAPEATTGYYPDSRATRRAPREEPKPEAEAPAPEQPPARTAAAPTHWPTKAGTDDSMN